MLERSPHGKRDTRIFIGGNWLNHGEKQSPGITALLNPENKPADTRLDMARWITSPENPLTSRVFTNRIFAELFGNGIVETLGDFGSTGLAPTNQPLLDHLAIAFQTTHKWSLKSLLREITLSATYRQDHKTNSALAQQDPRNHLLARGPRTRLTAEMIRDNALAAADLLTHKIGGPSVMPPQPDGIWQTVYNGSNWKTATGSRPLSACPLHLLETHQPLPLHDYLRRSHPRPLLRPPHPNQHPPSRPRHPQ